MFTTFEQSAAYEAQFEAFLSANPQLAALDDAAILDAMSPVDAVPSVALPLDIQLPF